MDTARTLEVLALRRQAEKLRQLACGADDVEEAQTLNRLADGYELDALELDIGEGPVLAILNGLRVLNR